MLSSFVALICVLIVRSSIIINLKINRDQIQFLWHDIIFINEHKQNIHIN